MPGPLGVDAAVQFTARVFRPVAQWMTDDDIFDYVTTLGWRLPSIPTGLVALNASAAALQAAAADLARAQRLDTSTTGPLAQVGASLTAVFGSLALVPASFNAELPG